MDFLVAQTTDKCHWKNSKRKINQQTIIENNRKIINNRKVKAMGNIKHTMQHYPRNGWIGDTDP